MSKTSNTIDKNVDEQIVKVLERFQQAYDARIALGPLKSSAYTRLRRDGLLTPEFIKSEYGLIAERSYRNMKIEGIEMKEFNLEKAKTGAPLCTRNGRKARILCYDYHNFGYPILAAVEIGGEECACKYTVNGRYIFGHEITSDEDLMLASVKHDGWVIIGRDNKCFTTIFASEEDAVKNASDSEKVAHIEWEEEK